MVLKLIGKAAGKKATEKVAKLKNKLKNKDISDKQKKVLQDKLKEAIVQEKKKNVIKTLKKEKSKQENLNVNQMTGEKTSKVVKGDVDDRVLKTAPLTKKELADKGMVSGASDFRLSMASLKGATKGLAQSLKNKKKEFDGLSDADKKGERGQLLKNAMNGIIKKLKGQVPIRTLRDAKLIPSGMSKGGLKTPTADQVGLKKLPTAVRNKMGYMYGGGMAKKPKMGNMDYRKGGLLLIAVDMMKKRKKGK